MSTYEQSTLGEPYLLTDQEQGITPEHKLADQGIITDDEAALLAGEEDFPYSRLKFQQELRRLGLLDNYLTEIALIED